MCARVVGPVDGSVSPLPIRSPRVDFRMNMAYRIGFVMEQTLGQITHTQNFMPWVAQDPEVEPIWILISYEKPSPLRSIPVVGDNWTMRASLEARARVREVRQRHALDALFLHTQVTTLFARRLMMEIPTVVSLDATPINFDTVGGPYGHRPSRFRIVEKAKNAIMRRNFSEARRLVIWHEAGKRSLIDDYGVPTERISVIPPGIDLERWKFSRDSSVRTGPIRLLFVGGDFRRKGGETLLKAFGSRLLHECELDIATREPVDTAGMANVRVHHGLGPNAPGLIDLYARADVFVFPTLADMLPLAIMEALAAGLPVIATTVGYLGEQVQDGVTGYLVAPGDEQALADATLRLVRDPSLRQTMGTAARRFAEQRFNSAVNYPGILAVCKAAARQRA
jgi:glycosyltransferase involved in cell wall biosynthesis